jgi:hypothetical protein
MATFIMLNPSTADANLDDPTIRRCIGFAKSWGCHGLLVVNLYALRAHNPRRLWEASDPVGPKNDTYLENYIDRALWLKWPLVAAWGANAKPDRVAQVLALARCGAMPGEESLQALGVTKSGAPRHPLYLRADAVLAPWPVTSDRIPEVAQCDHADLACPPGTCDWSGRDGRDG